MNDGLGTMNGKQKSALIRNMCESKRNAIGTHQTGEDFKNRVI